MSRVFFDAGISLDGFMAGENRGPGNPLGDNGPTIHNAGLIDEFTVHLAPVIIGSGIRLFDNLERRRFTIDVVEAVNSRSVTHLHCRVTNKIPIAR